jgi:tetratricopeptide (TPR) repeat protein
MPIKTPCWGRGASRGSSLLAASCLFACSVLPRSCGKEHPASPATTAPPKSPATVPAETLPLDPFQRRAALNAAYRLKPDLRVLLAVEAVQRFFVPVAAESATAVQESELWRIRLGPADIGTLPDLPDFQQALALLDAFAKRLAAEHPIVGPTPGAESSVEPLDWEPEAIAALREAQARWLKGEHSAELVRRACRALASLAFLELDTLGVGDILPAQALAMLAITHALGGKAAREESLVAAALGYTTAAQAAAKRLPEGDSLRLYLEHSPRLEASARGGPVTARYLQLRALRWADDEEGETRWLETELAGERNRLPVLALRLQQPQHGWQNPVAEAIPAYVLLAAAEQAGDPRVASLAKAVGNPSAVADALGFLEGRLLASASALIARVDTAASGPFYSGAVLQSYDRSMLYSALDEWSRTLLHALSSTDAAKELSHFLGQDRAPEARDFQRWLLLQIAARLPDPAATAAGANGKTPQNELSRVLEQLLFDGQQARTPPNLRAQLLQSLSELPNLGPEALLSLFEELRPRLNWADPMALTATRALSARLDSRVDHRIRFANLAWDALHDLAVEERLMRSAFRDSRSWHPRSDIWFAALDGDADILQDLARSPAVPFSLRVESVSALGRIVAWAPARVEEQLDQLGALHPLSSEPTDALVAFFTERKEYGKAAGAARKWLANNAGRQDLDVVVMQAALGRALYRQGRYQEAWQTVEPFLDSWQAGVMRTAADAATALGRTEDARRILRNYVKRYPDSTGPARSYWLLRDYDAAAQFLAHSPKPPNETDWAWYIGREFAEIFGPLPVVESQKAIAALHSAGLGYTPYQGLADAFAHAHFHEHAFAIVTALADQLHGPRSAPPLLLRGYLYLKEWKGDEAALTWIRSGPFLKDARPSLSLIVYELGAYALLWNLLPEPPAGRFADNFWLQRTASLLLDPKVATAERRNAAREHYQGAGSSHYHELGKFLLGQLDEREAAKLATDPEKACEVSYYLGLKAETEGRLEDATAWYRNAVESAMPRWTEYQWSFGALQRFQSSGKTLRRLNAERLAGKH